MDEITSLQNPGVKQVVKLRDRRGRDQSGLFLIEGYRELLRAVEAGRLIETVYFCEELFLGENERSLIERSKASPVSCTKQVFQKMSYRDRPDGLLAVAPQVHLPLESLPEVAAPLYVVAEAIEKPGNLGTILRSSDAVGADGVIVCDRCTDVHNPNVVRASTGTLFTLPVIEAGGEETLQFLRARGVTVVAATPSAELIYTEADLSGPVAIVVGTEQLGLSDDWMDQADLQVRIPMRGQADSLNVATATTLLLYEALRQRDSRSPLAK
jgi:TrmH family RNA methyltransferase